MFLTKYKNFEKSIALVGKTIKSSDTVELLGNIFDRYINFKLQIENVPKEITKRKLFPIRNS